MNFFEAKRAGDAFRMVEKCFAKALSLLIWAHCNILDMQMIRFMMWSVTACS
jgi:hypothetical protein